MKLLKTGLLKRGQKGFTLIELALAMAIGGIIAAAITMTMFQIVDSSGRTSNHMTAIRQAQSAGYWVTKDVHMAQVISTEDDEDGLPLEVSWTEWDGAEHNVTYELQGTDFVRQHNGEDVIIAQFVESVEVSPRPYPGGELTFTVNVQVGDGAAAQLETRTYEVIPRPGS
jgi:prepilin-type N-terminal cleavage/methylation domain-containing protein